jgi:hypothetical protein
LPTAVRKKQNKKEREKKRQRTLLVARLPRLPRAQRIDACCGKQP